MVPPVVNPVVYIPTQLPSDTSELYSERRRTDNDTVLVYIQGGPKNVLTRNNLTFLPNNLRYNQIQVHQVQTYNPTLIDSVLTAEAVKLETDVSIEIINRVIQYFKTRDKIVVVFGNSYGGWLLLRYLSIFGSNNADKFIITAARLDIESEVYNGLQQNISYIFPDYITPAIAGPQPRPGNTEDRLYALLKAVLGPDRNTQRLSSVDLSNMLFAYAEDDDLVGRLKQPEVDFLISKKVSIVASQGGHGSMWHSPYIDMIYDFIIQ